MSAPALRRVMALAAQSLDTALAAALYELLLRTPLHLPLRNGQPFAIEGPGGQLAVPVFLDRDALELWGGSSVASAVHSAQEAARLALSLTDAWLVVDLGSVPGSQPIARKGVEALARGSYPGEDESAQVRDAIAELGRAVRARKLTGEQLRAASKLRLFTIGKTHPTTGSDSDAAVYEIGSLDLFGVRGPDGASYLPGWATAGPMFAFLPELPRALTLELGSLIGYALSIERGIVLDPQGEAAALTADRLAMLWHPT